MSVLVGRKHFKVSHCGQSGVYEETWKQIQDNCVARYDEHF